jgi:hypothetical protein
MNTPPAEAIARVDPLALPLWRLPAPAPGKDSVGRPTVWSQERQARVCELLAHGARLFIACRLAGIGHETALEWKNKAREELEKGDHADLTLYFVQFHLATEDAFERWEAYHNVNIHSASILDARHSQWALSHHPRTRREWAQSNQTDVTVDLGSSAPLPLAISERARALPPGELTHETDRFTTVLDTIERNGVHVHIPQP